MPTFDQGNSARWRIFDAVATALETAPELQAVPVRRNPTSAVALKRGDYVLAVRGSGDSLLQRVGNDERRRFTLIVASMAHTEHSDRDADAMHAVVGSLLRRLMPTLNAFADVKEVETREADVTSYVEDFQPVEGALVLSGYEVTYRQSHRHPAFALTTPT
jgi:hypothetical protein